MNLSFEKINKEPKVEKDRNLLCVDDKIKL